MFNKRVPLVDVLFDLEYCACEQFSRDVYERFGEGGDDAEDNSDDWLLDISKIQRFNVKVPDIFEFLAAVSEYQWDSTHIRRGYHCYRPLVI